MNPASAREMCRMPPFRAEQANTRGEGICGLESHAKKLTRNTSSLETITVQLIGLIIQRRPRAMAE